MCAECAASVPSVTDSCTSGPFTPMAPAGAAPAVADESWLQAGDVLDIPGEQQLAVMPLADALEALRVAERQLLLGLGAVGETWQQRLKCAPPPAGRGPGRGPVPPLCDCCCPACSRAFPGITLLHSITAGQACRQHASRTPLTWVYFTLAHALCP